MLTACGFAIDFESAKSNTHSTIVTYGKEFSTFTTHEHPVLPGTMVQIGKKMRRVIYTKYRFGPDAHSDDNFSTSTTTIISTNDNTLMSEVQLLSVLPIEDADLLQMQIMNDHNISVLIGHIDRGGNATIDFTPNTHVVNTNLLTRDTNNVNLQAPYLNATTISSPFCGLTEDRTSVGIVYPKVDNMLDVIINNRGHHDSAITVANLWNVGDKYPLALESDKDYRFTLLGGHTEYVHPVINSKYDATNPSSEYVLHNNYIHAMKGNMSIGIWSDPSYASVPVVDVGGLEITAGSDHELSAVKLFAKKKSGNSYGDEMYVLLNHADGKLTIKNGSRTITIDGTTVDVT